MMLMGTAFVLVMTSGAAVPSMIALDRGGSLTSWASITAAGYTSADQARRPSVRPQGMHLSIRAFGFLAAQRFSASQTFGAIFESAAGSFVGGGAQVVHPNGLYGEITVSRFTKTGERALLVNGEPYRFGVPLTATITPVELTAGYRFRLRRYRDLIPYAGAGIGSYAYEETSDDSSSGEDVNATHAGVLMVGGLEYRLHRWLGIAADAQYTNIPGILGAGGLSKDLGETRLGGLAARVRVIVGR
jgi:hypothetical protein